MTDKNVPSLITPAGDSELAPTPKVNNRRTVTVTLPALKRPAVPAVVQSSRFRSGLLAVAFLLTAVLGGIGGGWLEAHHENAHQVDTTLAGQKKIVTNESLLISQIAKTVGPSVVSVNVSLTTQSAVPPGFEGLFGIGGGGGAQTAQAAGTGIIISEDGIIVTNRHVVPEGTNSVSVTLSDGTELKDVSVIGRTKPTDSLDIAFLKIKDLKGHQLKPASIGDSSKMQVGDNVVAIGNALGQFQNTVTSGILSGFGRSVQASSGGGPTAAGDTESLDNLFQTDAAINEGNSGGPLVNLNGQVIGINTAIAGNAQNVGFSIPINDVKGLIGQVLKNGKVVRPYLGVKYTPVTADIAKQHNLQTSHGAYIIPSDDPASPSVLPGSAAANAGLKEGDVIIKVANTEVDATHSLTSLLGAHQPDEKVVLTIERDGNSQQITVTLGETPAN